MNRLTILSWNVNSVRRRARALGRLLATHRPDVLCLQETKVADERFPLDRLERHGYRHYQLLGQKSYNGVAVFSKLAFSDARSLDWCRRRDCRHLHVTLPGGIELHNLYAPAGGPLPDPDRNPKFAHKLRFYRELTGYFRRQRPRSKPIVLVGDLNVAPLPEDVWSHEKLKNVVTHTPREVSAMRRLFRSLDFVDAVRRFRPAPERVFTWWSYRAPDFRKVNKGRRLDHAWVTPPLRESLSSARVLDEVRGWRTPSDHAPLLLELEL
jgi:exodeoxyribonuclease-3